MSDEDKDKSGNSAKEERDGPEEKGEGAVNGVSPVEGFNGDSDNDDETTHVFQNNFTRQQFQREEEGSASTIPILVAL